ncbi:hypothetical protein K488DRAFT_13408, partial [Vararia minispora EC-137]
GAPSEAYTSWKNIDSRSAGAIILSISEKERSTVQDDEHSGSALWSSLKAYHVQVKPQVHFNEYNFFCPIRLQEGEKLAAIATRVEDGMRRIKSPYVL